MPFAITCPKCAVRFRKSKERPAGTGVECSKCGEQFYVSADNQAEWSDRPPVAAPRTKAVPEDDETPRRRPRDDDDEVDLDDAPRSLKPRDDEDAPRSRRVREEDSDDEVDLDDRPRRRSREGDEIKADDARPRQNRGRRKPVLLILGVFGLVVLFGGGVGAYFLFFSGGGDSADDKVRPKRDLPTDLFVYRPSEGASIDVRNVALMRGDANADPVYMPPLEATLPRGHGIKPEQIEVFCEMRDPKNNRVPPVVALLLVDPIDLATVAARCKLDPGPRPGLFSKAATSSAWVAFQPGPSRLVFVGSNFDNKSDLETMAKIASQTTADSDLPPSMKDGLALASGYPSIHASVKPYGDLEFYVVGRYKETAGVREEFAVRIHNSPAAAKETYAKEIKTWAALTAGPQAGRSESAGTFRRPALWTRGDRTFFLDRLSVGKGP